MSGAASVSIVIPISKTNDEQRVVCGWASVVEVDGSPVVDSQGDTISEAELEKAFYEFAEEAGIAGDMHERIGVGKMVECMVFTKAKQELLGINLGKVGAWVGFRVDDDVFKRVKSGELTMFSIGGTGMREAA